MKKKLQLTGIVAAPFTPFGDDNEVKIDSIPAYADHLSQSGLSGAFICGTTGESLSLTTEERLSVASKWVTSASDDLKVIVHVGHSGLEDAKRLAAHAQSIGAWGIGQIAPSFFKPDNVEELVQFCAETAASAPDLPYYYYHMPSMTGVNIKVFDFLSVAKDRIANLAGVKFTHEDLMDLRLSMAIDDGRFEMLLGRDELMICGLTLGCRGAVGSTFNFLAPLYLELWEAFERGDLKRANELQLISMQVIQILSRQGDSFISRGKAIMKMLGIDCGEVRLPLRGVSEANRDVLKKDLTEVGFFQYAANRIPSV